MARGQHLSHLLKFEDSDLSVRIPAGDLLLSTLLRYGIIFPYACQTGICGTCKCHLIKGEVVLESYSDFALSAAEFNQGLILACRARLLSNVTIRKLSR